jgi:hypothetical protein
LRLKIESSVLAYDEIVLGIEIEPIETVSAQTNELTDLARKETALTK